MACALLGFYMILKAVPQFASSVLSGSAPGMDGGMVRAAAMAGYGLGMTVFNSSRTMAQGVIGAGNTVSQAAQTYQYTAQSAKDTGSAPVEAKTAGAKEAFATVMTGPQPGGPRAAGERIYADNQRAQQFADVRGSGANAGETNANTISAPASQTGTESAASSGKTINNVTIAGSNAAASAARDVYESKEPSASDSWGSFASDRAKSKNGEKR
jgi:hypothetical protein